MTTTIDEQAQRRMTTQQWSGAQDLGRLQATLRCSAPDPRAFRAESRSFTTVGVVLNEWRSTQLSGTAGTDRSDAALTLVLVLGGRVRYATAAKTWDGAAQSLHLLRGDEPYRWACANGTHLMRITLSPEHLPPQLRRPAASPAGPLEATKLAAAFSAALEQGVSAAADAHRATLHLTRGLHNLAVALIDEQAPTTADESIDLRERILDHIDQHLADQQLNPRTIAEAFSVSLRWVHQAFNTEHTSVARHIRHRRVDAVAECLRVERQHPRLTMLALRFGFSGREQLARCFRARYGMTVGAYAAAVLEGTELPRPFEEEADDSQVA